MPAFQRRLSRDALVKSLSRALNDFRSQAKLPRFNLPQKLMEVAQLSAVAELLSLRRPDLLQAHDVPIVACEPDVEPDLDTEVPKDIFAHQASSEAQASITGREVAKILLECVPAFRLGLTAESLSEVLRLSEARPGENWRSFRGR
eukprot:Skav236202  [mRNA]  locus=scaffold4200:40745:43760:- [translate_table: standard]